MNAKELRRAAEVLSNRAAAYFEEYMIEGHDDPDSRGLFERIDLVASHILSTVRDDDDEEYCSDWGRSVIGTSEVTLNERFSLDTHRCDIEYDDLQPHQVSCGSLRTRVNTQGDFRELCRLLGVTLKE